MEIKDYDFKLVYDEEHDRFNLYTIKVINAKDPEKRREEYSIYGYSMTIQGALKKIIHQRMNKKKDIYSLREYLKEYSEQLDELRYIADKTQELNGK